MAKKLTLVERLARTRAMRSSRARQIERLDKAKRDALAPKPPELAIESYMSVMSTFHARVQRLTERHVLSRLPAKGAFSPSDLALGMAALEVDLYLLVGKMRRSARAAGARTAAHGQKEVSRMMQVVVPSDTRSDALVEDFAARNITLLRNVVTAQVNRLRRLADEVQDAETYRKQALQKTWIARDRSKLIARTECYRFHRTTIRFWAVAAGSEECVYVTRHDERVRGSHAALDGKRFSWSNPPPQLQEPNCRCELMPVEPLAPGWER